MGKSHQNSLVLPLVTHANTHGGTKRAEGATWREESGGKVSFAKETFFSDCQNGWMRRNGKPTHNREEIKAFFTIVNLVMGRKRFSPIYRNEIGAFRSLSSAKLRTQEPVPSKKKKSQAQEPKKKSRRREIQLYAYYAAWVCHGTVDQSLPKNY